jgi:carbon-monoxide dehydrogenase small subunit
MLRTIHVTVNGEARVLEVRTHHTLLHVLREQLLLRGAREGCGIGMCGACTVLVDGEPISGCLMLAAQADGKELVTIEGLAQSDGLGAGVLDPIQDAYLDANGFQCAFCTPGFILATKALLDESPDATSDEIAEYLSGHLCRCGSYTKIMDAVKLAQARNREV